MSRKLYTSYTSPENNVPFLVSFDGQSNLQAYANNEDKYGDTEYIRVTDENGNNVKAVIPNTDSKAHQLVIRLNEGGAGDLCYVENDGAVSSTSIQVIEIASEPTPTQYTLTIDPTPDDATVTLTATGFTQVGNSITVDGGTTVSYTVSKPYYVTVADSIVVNGNRSCSVVLREQAPNVVGDPDFG